MEKEVLSVLPPSSKCNSSGPRKARKVTARQVLDITVLMGGPSTEREVSMVSGKAIADALERRGHRVTRADISPHDTSALDRPGLDVVFIALHGDFGESGEVQKLCQAKGLRYTGSDEAASRLGIDKIASKERFRKAGLITPDWALIGRGDDAAARRRMLEPLSLPVVVKPVDGGSSVDLTVAPDAAARDGAVESVVAKYGQAMVERFVAGRELTVGILGEQALPVIEILVRGGGTYDYEAKYSDESGTQYVFDHGIADDIVRRVQADALTAYRVLGCRDLSRVDFRLDAAGVPQILEINTIPGFTSHSLLPMAARKAGISFEELVDRIAWMAMERQSRP